MNKKIITVIQLLNRTANGEEIPKTVKCNGKKYNYHDYSKNYYYIEDTEECLFDDNIAFLANDEVEILEDNTEEIEEIDLFDNGQGFNDIKIIIQSYDRNFQQLNDVVNKIGKAINELRKDKSNE